MFSAANTPAGVMFSATNTPAGVMFSATNTPTDVIFSATNKPTDFVFSATNTPTDVIFSATDEICTSVYPANILLKTKFKQAFNQKLIGKSTKPLNHISHLLFQCHVQLNSFLPDVLYGDRRSSVVAAMDVNLQSSQRVGK